MLKNWKNASNGPNPILLIGMKFDIRSFIELWLHLYFSRSNHANHVVADFHGVHLGTPQEPEKDRKRNSRSNSKSSSQSSPSYGCTVKGRKVRSLIYTFIHSFTQHSLLHSIIHDIIHLHIHLCFRCFGYHLNSWFNCV